MTIENLIKVLPPPVAPVSAFSGPWEPIEAELRTSLPQDYKDFCRLYGLGHLIEFFGLYAPVSKSPYQQLVRAVRSMRYLFSYIEPPPPLWPARGGLLACGQTDNGDQLFWLTRGHLSEWPIVVWDRGLQEFETFECDITDFLAGVINGDIRPAAFPDDAEWLEEVELFRQSADDWSEPPSSP